MGFDGIKTAATGQDELPSLSREIASSGEQAGQIVCLAGTAIEASLRMRGDGFFEGGVRILPVHCVSFRPCLQQEREAGTIYAREWARRMVNAGIVINENSRRMV